MNRIVMCWVLILSGCSVTQVAQVDNVFTGYDAKPAPNTIAKQAVSEAVHEIAEANIVDVESQESVDELVFQFDPRDKEDIRKLQQALHKQGFNPGPIDGIMGEKTRSALKEFRGTHNFSTEELLSREEMHILFSG